MIVGPDEENLRSRLEVVAAEAGQYLRFASFTPVPERYMAASDVFCLPSHREGFGSAVIEAGAAGIPTIGSRIYGIIDAIEDNVTGLLHDPKSSQDILAKMEVFACDATSRRAMGDAARRRAVSDFSRESSTNALLELYASIWERCTDPL